MLIAKRLQLLIVVGDVIARRQTTTAAFQRTREFVRHRVEILCVMQYLASVDCGKTLVRKRKSFAELSHYLNRKSRVLYHPFDGAGSDFSAVVGFERGNHPAILRECEAGDTIACAEIENTFSVSWSKQTKHFRKLFTRGVTLRGGEHRQIEIVVPNLGFVVRLFAKPPDGFFPRKCASITHKGRFEQK